MADLLETSTFPEGVYRIETTDPVVGGEDGIANKAAKQLAARTRWLKDQVAAILASLSTTYALRNGDYSTLRARATTKADVGLSEVPNFAATDDASGGSSTLLATAKAVRDHVAARFGATVSAGAGLSGGGTLASNPTIALGLPSTLSGVTGNLATGATHYHAIASTDQRTNPSSALLLQAKALADHVAAGDHALASAGAHGFMAAADKSKLDTIQPGAQVNPGLASGAAAGLMSAGDKAKLDTIALGANVWPGVYTGGARDQLDFPVGSYVVITNTGEIERNSDAVVRLNPDRIGGFRLAGTGPALTGAWRRRGFVNFGVGDVNFTLCQRVA